MIQFTPSSNGKPETGKIILSEPFMADPHFGRKAILICEHNEEGSFGFVLNNFIEVGLNELLDDLPKVQCRLSLGGPVKNSNLYYLHTLDDAPEAIVVKPGLFMGGDFDWVRSLLEAGQQLEGKLRFFIGYAGWTPGQLEEEIKSHSWFVTSADIETIMSTDTEDEEFWKALISEMGAGFEHIANAPADPSMN